MVVTATATLPRLGHAAGPPEPRQLQAAHVPRGSIRVDGRADDPGWSAARRAQHFVQKDPAEGRAPAEQTWASVAYDDDAIYIVIEALDRQPDKIRGQVTSRDEWNVDLDAGRAFNQHSDLVEVWLDPQNDGVTAYTFTVNAAGIQVDARYSAAGEVRDPVWNGVWDSAVARSADGWIAELRVPVSQLRYDPEETSWGIQVLRYQHRENETSVFSPTPRNDLRPLRYMARLDGINHLPPSTSLEVTPYVVTALSNTRGDLALRARAGGDARLVLGAASVVQLSIVPDFGQVEQDPSVLNLTAYEVFRTERRPFFVDGQELFAYPVLSREMTNETLYYSRRIGAAPALDSSISPAQVVDMPRETTILGAAKFIGRSPGGFGYSALSALTGRERATVLDDGTRVDPIVASPTNFSLLRLRHELGASGSNVGTMLTNTYRFLDAELATTTPRIATTGALDVDLRFGEFGATGNVIGSRISGTAAALDVVQRSSAHNLQRPDAKHLAYDPRRTEMVGYGFGVKAGKLSGAPWLAWMALQVRNPYLELNDLGYLRNADQQSLFGNITWQENTPTRVYRDYSLALTAWNERTFGHELTSRGAQVELTMTLANSWSGYLGLLRRQEALDVTLLRGGPAFLAPGGFGGWCGVTSDARKPFNARLELSGDYNDERSLRTLKSSLKLSVRPYSALTLTLVPAHEISRNDMQYVDTRDSTAGPQPLLGNLSQETVSLTLRLSWALMRGLTVEAYAMPYVTAGTYDTFYAVTRAAAPRYSDRRIAIQDYVGADRFLAAEVRSNTVLRWDYLPGSSIYLAWAHEQTEQRVVGELDPVRDLRELVGAPSTDVVFLKWAHYLDL